MHQDYSVKYIADPRNHIRNLGPTGGAWEELDLSQHRLTGGSSNVRYTKLEIEMPGWLDDLVEEYPSPEGPPVAVTSAEPAKKLGGKRPTKDGFFGKLGRLLGARN